MKNSDDNARKGLGLLLKFVVIFCLLWGLVTNYKKLKAGVNKVVSTEVIDLSFFKGSVIKPEQVSSSYLQIIFSESNYIMESYEIKEVDRSTALGFDSTALLIYNTTGMIIWKPKGVNERTYFRYNYDYKSMGMNRYHKVGYSEDDRRLIFYSYRWYGKYIVFNLIAVAISLIVFAIANAIINRLIK